MRRSRNSSVVWPQATGWMIGGFESRQELGIFLFTIAYRPSLVPTQPPIQWVSGALSLGVKRWSVKLITYLQLVPKSKNEWSYTFTPPIRLHGVVLKLQKHRNNFTLYLCLHVLSDFECFFSYFMTFFSNTKKFVTYTCISNEKSAISYFSAL
jgi:hypothetical protein